MRAVSNTFKELIKEPRIINSKIIFGTTTLTEDELNDIQYSFNADLFKTICQELDVDSNIKIDVDTQLNYQFGLYIEDDENYEWVDYGNFKVYSVEELKDVSAYKMICYDRMAESMIPYDKENETEQTDLTGMTIRQAFVTLFTDLGWSTAVIPASFTNSTQIITSDPYIGMQYTYRDILDELCTIACVWLGDVNGVIEFMTPNTTSEILDEEICSEDNVEIGEQVFFNSVVFSRSAGTDNIYRKDDTSIETNGLHEYNLADYLILNSNDRENYIDGVWNNIKNFSYYALNIKTVGVTYLERLDTFSFSINGDLYPTLLLNDETSISSGLSETIYNEKPSETHTDYQYASTTDKANRTAQIIVDKQNAQIQLEVSQKLDEEDFTSANIILAINDGQSSAEINADKISLAGKEIDLTSGNISITSDNFQVDTEGNMTCKDGTFTGGNITLQDDGTEENASLRVQTKITQAKSYAVGDDLSSEWIKIIVNKESTLPKPNELAHTWGGGGEYNRYSTLIESNDYRIILHAYRVTQQDNRYADFYSLDLRYKNTGEYVILWTLTIGYNADDTIRAKRENRHFEEYQLPDDFGELTLINPDNIVSSATLLSNYFLLVEYVNREFTYSGYGISSDIYSTETFTTNDVNRVLGIIQGTIIATQDDYEKYDLNGNGEIDSDDLSYIRVLAYNWEFSESDLEELQNILMSGATPTQAQIDKYDLNFDGELDSADLIIMRKVINLSFTKDSPTRLEINTKRLGRNIAFYVGNEEAPVTAMDSKGFWQNEVNLYDKMFESKILWSGGSFMQANQTATLSEAINKQKTGIVLVWSAYDSNGVEDWWWNTTFIPKQWVELHPNGGITCNMSGGGFSAIGSKYVYVTDTEITGNAINSQTGTTNGITWKNNQFVLRYVIGV